MRREGRPHVIGTDLAPATPIGRGFSLFVCVIFVRCRRRFSIVVQTPARTCRDGPPDEVTDENDTYQSFQCVACTGVHLVNVKTGKVLGEEED